MNNAPFEMLVTSVGAVACWLLWFYFIKEYRVSAFRERLFSIRDELFAFAADDGVSFNETAYLQLRDLINGMLQFAHRVSFLTLLTSARSSMPSSEDSTPQRLWEKSLEVLDPAVKERLERIHGEIVYAYMKQLVEGSIVLFPTAIILFIGFSLRARLKRYFSMQEMGKGDPKTAMVRDLARTLNAQVLEVEAYRESKNSLELSIA
jgi:hypothetical protein